ncbi:lipocalin family protein [Muriicola jejuensis]|uniref:Uncharacterized protein n=1 Tax=Muriicola jejuensis TaxID=504488 RepID=A0A6P0U8V3_9FLAO|nr:lipocalin family protein [Muriicola jejuensis]NER09534.1 hypothetical protein [Muriicola jejuensis]
MIKKAIFYMVFGLFLSGCSTDKMADASTDSILGTWELTALDLNEGSASTEEEFAQDILDLLSASNCYLLTLTFEEDGTLVTTDATNYLEIGVNGQGTGLEVPCPTQRDTYNSTYTYAEGVLTFIDENQQTVSVEVTISGNVMVLSAQDLDVENFNAGGNLLFTKR